MEAALRVLKDHPFSDEAVFASLALIAKHVKQDEFVSKRPELFHAIGGSSFFRRLLTTKKMEAIALNVLTCFCEDSQCASIIKLECATELLSACESVLNSKDEQALRDSLHCLRALEDLSGTARFLLDVISKSDSNIRQTSLETFASTKDAFFLDSDALICLTLVESYPVEYGFHLCCGLVNRWSISSASQISNNMLSQACSIIEKFLREKNLDSQLRSAVLRLCSVVLDINKEFVLSTRDNLLMLLVVVCSIELRVSLDRAVNDLRFFSQDQTQNSKMSLLMVTCDACTIIDRIASWFAIHSNEIESDKLVDNVLSNLTSACEAASLYFNTSREPHEQLDTLLTCMLCSIMQIFWMDDPISLRGIKEVFTRGKIKDALGNMVWRTHPSALRFLLPLLMQLPPEMWTKRLLENDARNLHRIIENELINGTLSDVSSPSRFVYAILVVVLTLIEFPDVLFTNASVAESLHTAFREAKAIKMQTLNEIAHLCVQGSLLLLESFVNMQNAGDLSTRAKQFATSADTLLKNHLSVDGLHDIGEAEYTLLGSGLNWKDLAKVTELVRFECHAG